MADAGLAAGRADISHEKANTQHGIRSIQILRAIASTSVVYFHIGATPIFGASGVDIFFVISGFVMAKIVTDGQGLFDFAASRIARICPLYWIVTAATLALIILKPSLFEYTKASLANFSKSVLFIPYFKESGALKPMVAWGWTLNYEMFFYICIWISMAINRRLFIAITTAILLLVYVVLGKSSNNSVANAFFGNDVIFEFVLGMIAYVVYRKGYFRNLPAIVCLIVAMLSLASMEYLETRLLNISNVFLYGFPAAVLVLALLGLEQTAFIKGSLLALAFAAIGDASYATYLSHFYIVRAMESLANHRLPILSASTPFGVLLVVGVSLVAGQLLYIGCDRPLSRVFKKTLLMLNRADRRAVGSAA